MRQLTQEVCKDQYKHLVLIRSMPIRWNTALVEINRGVCLHPALNRWIQEMNWGLTSKKKAAATQKSKQLYLSPIDWDNLKLISNVLDVRPFNFSCFLYSLLVAPQQLHQATLDFSKKEVPTISKLLVLYKAIKEHLVACTVRLTGLKSVESCNIQGAIEAALKKLRSDMMKALESDYPLLSVGMYILHNCMLVHY